MRLEGFQKDWTHRTIDRADATRGPVSTYTSCSYVFFIIFKVIFAAMRPMNGFFFL